MRLKRSGAIRKIRHGVFISADAAEGADAEIPPMNVGEKNVPGKRQIERPTYDKLVAMLNKPRSSGELREALGISRQRIDQLLKKLLEEDKLWRFEFTSERGNFVYVLSEFYNKGDLSIRSPILRGPRDRLLSALSPENWCRAAELSLIALSSKGLVDHLEQLSALGLITKFKLGHHTYVGITSQGIAHPQYDRAAPKCRPADLLADFGEARVKFVQYLQLLGSARTVDLTYAMPKGYFDGKPQGSGQIIQALEHAGIVQKVEAGSRRYPRYSLTDKGSFLSGVFARVNAPPSVKDLRESIAERKRENSERLRRIRLSKISRELLIGSPNQAAIVHALGQAGRPLTTMQILNMDIKFNNPRSIHLALHALGTAGCYSAGGDWPEEGKHLGFADSEVAYAG
jgi:DNA-binding HxlR family transcriptional regulator